MSSLSASLVRSAAAVATFDESHESFSAMDEAQLRVAVRAIAELRRHVDQFAALAASEVAQRSRREFGHQGFAQKAGFVSPAAMLQVDAQISKFEATRLLQMGAMLADVDASQRMLDAADHADLDRAPDHPTDTYPNFNSESGVLVPEWQNLLAHEVVEGRMSLEKVDAIRRVMSEIAPTGDTSASSTCGASDAAIASAVAELIAAAPQMSPEQTFRAAKTARDTLDSEAIARREKAQYDLRSVRTWWDAATGMHCGTWKLAPEDGALVAEAFQQILSPRRGGPRFVRTDEKKTAEDLIADPRTDEQITADAFTEMIRLAVDADSGTLFGSRRPAVRVIVSADQLASLEPEHTTPAGTGFGLGYGYIEGRNDTVSGATVERHLCNTGVISIGFDTDGHCVNVGRTQRLFTERQRIGLSVRDGGCRFPGCDRPPSYTEAHHINPWQAKNGKTDINDGILLCRRHHLLIHNNNWTVHRNGPTYLLTPPRTVDPQQHPADMPSRSPIATKLQRATQPALPGPATRPSAPATTRVG